MGIFDPVNSALAGGGGDNLAGFGSDMPGGNVAFDSSAGTPLFGGAAAGGSAWAPDASAGNSLFGGSASPGGVSATSNESAFSVNSLLQGFTGLVNSVVPVIPSFLAANAAQAQSKAVQANAAGVTATAAAVTTTKLLLYGGIAAVVLFLIMRRK